MRKGAKSIRVDVHLTSKTASREELEALVSEMQKNSPIHDTLANPVEMITRPRDVRDVMLPFRMQDGSDVQLCTILSQ